MNILSLTIQWIIFRLDLSRFFKETKVFCLAKKVQLIQTLIFGQKVYLNDFLESIILVYRDVFFFQPINSNRWCPPLERFHCPVRILYILLILMHLYCIYLYCEISYHKN